MPGFGANTQVRVLRLETRTHPITISCSSMRIEMLSVAPQPVSTDYLAPSNTCVFACLVPVRKYSALGCVDKAGSWFCVHTYAPRNLFSYIHIIFVLNRAHRRRQSLGFMGFRGFMLDLSLLVDPR